MSEEISTVATDAYLPTGTWTVDSTASRIGFAAKHMWGLAKVKGEFERTRGVLTVGASAMDAELTIDAASLNTGNKRRDQHLRSADFFGAAAYPEIRFEASAVTYRPGGLTIAGDLQIGESRLRLHLPVEVYGGIDQLTLTTRAVLNRELVGLGWNRLGMIGSEASVDLELTLTRDS
jgi:polyisoprenoid-binding protein YceI